jgi:hypothetical protein
MKLKDVKHQRDYQFLATFVNGEVATVDLSELISNYVQPQEARTAHVNEEWGCLEFNNGKVDIEPKTLYSYAKSHSTQIH